MGIFVNSTKYREPDGEANEMDTNQVKVITKAHLEEGESECQ